MTRRMILVTLWHFPATNLMTSRLFTSALFAGLLAGLIAVLLQFSLMEPLILEGEEYESGAKTHFAGVPSADGLSGTEIASHDHAAGTPEAHDHDAVSGTESDHGSEPTENLARRYSLAFFADFVGWVGYGLVLVAGFSLADRFGNKITIKDGLLWGIAGFTSFQLAPGLGLSPELPGVPAADLQARQIWWVAAAAATILALALFAYGQGLIYKGLGVVPLLLPHLIGAPHLDEFLGTAPPGLAAEFVTHSYAISMVAWATLGLSAGYFWNRSSLDQTA